MLFGLGHKQCVLCPFQKVCHQPVAFPSGSFLNLDNSFAAMNPCLLQNLAMSGLEGKRPAQWLAEQTKGYSGADLHELATEAARNSVLSMTSALATLR